MVKRTETYYCDICGKELTDEDLLAGLEKVIYLPYRKPFKDDNGVIVHYELYDNLHVEDICKDCHVKIATYISSLMPEENIGHCGTYRGK